MRNNKLEQQTKVRESIDKKVTKLWSADIVRDHLIPKFMNFY